MSISSVNGVASTVSRYRFVAAGGETSLTGSDANGATLSYLVGKEEVYLNGALLVRGQDYTGTDGATISSLTALVAGDTVEIITFVPFAIPTAISSATVTTQGDLIVATGASAVTRLGVGTSGQYLGSNGTTPTWGTPASGSMTLLSTTTLSGTSTTVSGISGSYTNLMVVLPKFYSGTATGRRISIWPNGTSGNGYGVLTYQGATPSAVANITDNPTGMASGDVGASAVLHITNYADTNMYKPYLFYGNDFPYSSGSSLPFITAGVIGSNSAITSLTFDGNGTLLGTVKIYGVN